MLYSNPKSAPAVKHDPEPESKTKRARAEKTRERIEALTNEENRTKSRAEIRRDDGETDRENVCKYKDVEGSR